MAREVALRTVGSITSMSPLLLFSICVPSADAILLLRWSGRFGAIAKSAGVPCIMLDMSQLSMRSMSKSYAHALLLSVGLFALHTFVLFELARAVTPLPDYSEDLA
jgi:hypothetical protein